jgi:4a-hydroxytetrahydrobiopterin dehydratase
MLLSDAEIEHKLRTLPGWEPGDGAIRKQFTFSRFMEAVAFVNRVADLAEAADHHPDITISYRKVTLTLSTHSAGGITGKDFELAAGIERILS